MGTECLSVWGHEDRLETMVPTAARLCKCAQSHRTGHFTWVKMVIMLRVL